MCNNGKTAEQTDGNPEYGYVDVAGPSTIKQGEEVEMFETEVNSEGVETEVNFCDQDAFSYPGDSFLDDSCVEENNETGDKDDKDIDLLQEILDHDLDDISDSNDEPEITISEKPIFEGSPLTLTMHIIAIGFKMGRFKSWHPFIVFPIVQQLLCFFEDKLFVSQLDYKFKHEQEKQERGTPDHIEDIIARQHFLASA